MASSWSTSWSTNWGNAWGVPIPTVPDDEVTSPLVITWGAHVTMDSNPLTFPTRIRDHLGGSGKIVDFKAARTWISDKVFARTIVSIQQPPILCGCVQFKDTVCLVTKITDYVAAKVRTPGIDT